MKAENPKLCIRLIGLILKILTMNQFHNSIKEYPLDIKTDNRNNNFIIEFIIS